MTDEKKLEIKMECLRLAVGLQTAHIAGNTKSTVDIYKELIAVLDLK